MRTHRLVYIWDLHSIGQNNPRIKELSTQLIFSQSQFILTIFVNISKVKFTHDSEAKAGQTLQPNLNQIDKQLYNMNIFNIQFHICQQYQHLPRINFKAASNLHFLARFS